MQLPIGFISGGDGMWMFLAGPSRSLARDGVKSRFGEAFGLTMRSVACG